MLSRICRARRPRGRFAAHVLGVPLVVCMLATGCSDGDAGRAASTATVAATPTTSASAPSTGTSSGSASGVTGVDAILGHIDALAGRIGRRVAGTAGEQQAAAYIEARLRDAGYTTAVEEFTFDHPYEESALAIPSGTLRVVALTGSPEQIASGALVMVPGTGRAEEFAAVDVRGRVAVVARGAIPFSDKARNAAAAGAVALVVMNNDNGLFRGTLGDYRASIPVVAIDGADRGTLLSALRSEVTVTARSGVRRETSRNVVGRRGDRCEAYVGAHYDSVPEGPGANDNASGTAMMLELARAFARPNLCVVAFGAEEYGLWGSQAFVAAHPVAGIKFVLNLDMVGRVTERQIVGDKALTERILGYLNKAGATGFRAGEFPPFASSDHVSFTAAGVPAVTLHSGDDSRMHTPDDTPANIDRASVQTMLRGAEAALHGLLGD